MGEKKEMRELFQIPKPDHARIANDIASKHYKSSFTDQQSLERWIYTALKNSFELGARSREVEKETELLQWLEAQQNNQKCEG